MTIRKHTTTRYIDDETGQEYLFEPIEDTIELKQIADGYELRYLTYDENPVSPDDDLWDGDVFLVHYHRSFHVENKLCPKDVLGYLYTENADEYDKERAEELLKTHYCFPVDAYIHSGVRLSLAGGFNGKLPGGHEQFDVSHTGAILVKKKEFGSGGVEFEHTQEEARTMAESLLETWNQYLSGDVYCVICEKLDKDKQRVDYDVIGGYFGFDYAKECLKAI